MERTVEVTKRTVKLKNKGAKREVENAPTSLPPGTIIVVPPAGDDGDGWRGGGGGRRRKNKRKKKHTQSLKRIQRVENRVTKVGEILSDAVEGGLDKYRKERKWSAKKTKDGALVYFGDNVAKALEKVQKIAAPAWPKLVKSRKSGRKDIRETAKSIVGFFPFL
jgi:hypothetical protein